MDQQIKRPIQVTSNDGAKKQFRSYQWLIGQEAKWALSVSTFFVDDPDLLTKVTPDQLRILKARYSYLSHLEHEQAHNAAPSAVTIRPTAEAKAEAKADEIIEIKTKRPRINAN